MGCRCDKFKKHSIIEPGIVPLTILNQHRQLTEAAVEGERPATIAKAKFKLELADVKEPEVEEELGATLTGRLSTAKA
jgi:hypothetical protein